MKRQLARACRWLAGRLLALAQHLDPATTDAAVAGYELGLAMARTVAAFSQFGQGFLAAIERQEVQP